MGLFILRRTGVMLLTAVCLTFIVFFMTNLFPNLEKLARTQGNFRMSDEAVISWLDKQGYMQPMPVKYGQWLGVLPGWTRVDDEGTTGRCLIGAVSAEEAAAAPRYCGIPTFMRTPYVTDLSKLDIALVGVPYDGAVEARSGARQAGHSSRTFSRAGRQAGQ